MSDDNSSPESVSDPEDTQEQGATKEARAPVGDGPPPRAKGGSSTWFIIGFAVLLAVVAALVIFFVVRGLNPTGGSNSTESSMPDEVVSNEMGGTENTSPEEEATTKLLVLREVFDYIPEHKYAQLAFALGRPYADPQNRCPYEMSSFKNSVFEFRGRIRNKRIGLQRSIKGSDPNDHYMVDMAVRIRKEDLRGQRAFVAIVLPQTKGNVSLIYVLEGCTRRATQVGLLRDIDPHLPRVRRKIAALINQQELQTVSRLSCIDMTDPRDSSLIIIRTLLDLAYGRSRPELKIVNCNVRNRRCSVIHRIEEQGLLSQLTTPVDTFLLAGNLPSSRNRFRRMLRRKSPVLSAHSHVSTWCISGRDRPLAPGDDGPAWGNAVDPHENEGVHGWPDIDEDNEHPPGFIPPDSSGLRRRLN